MYGIYHDPFGDFVYLENVTVLKGVPYNIYHNIYAFCIRLERICQK